LPEAVLNSLTYLRSNIAVLLAVALSCAPVPGQNVAVVPAAEDDLRIEVVDGNDFVNNIRQRTARDPVVEVRDRNNRPVAGALVIFTLPTSGPSGSFTNGLQSFSTTTDASGRAVGQGLTPNSTTGKFRIDVQAEQGGRVARTVINGKNISGFKFPLKASVTTAVVAATAAAIVAVVVANSGSSSGTGVSVGAPTIGSK
jgi:hypothetical protein